MALQQARLLRHMLQAAAYSAPIGIGVGQSTSPNASQTVSLWPEECEYMFHAFFLHFQVPIIEAQLLLL